MADDREQRPDSEFRVVRDGNGDGPGFGSTLHDNVAAAPSYFEESVLIEDATDFTSRQDAKLTHAPLRRW